MPSDFRSGGWHDLDGDLSDSVSGGNGYKAAIMDPMKAVRIYLGVVR